MFIFAYRRNAQDPLLSPESALNIAYYARWGVCLCDDIWKMPQKLHEYGSILCHSEEEIAMQVIEF